MVKRALISVSDKTGIVELAGELSGLGIEIVSTGGTAKALKDAGIPVIGISEVTGFPECLDGRVKTLHPAIHGGLLAMRGNPEHMKRIEELGITPIDLVVVNLYPFEATIMKEGVSFAEAIENIDIGGPTMIRAAAKNHQDVAVVVDPADYEVVLQEIKQTGDVSAKTKLDLCYKVFETTAAYDAMIADYLKKVRGDDSFPERLTLTYKLAQGMRYGENPHQKAAFYKEIGKLPACLPDAVQLNGKELSYNNINDTNGALDLLKEFDGEIAVVGCKHANPCGVGVADTVFEAYTKAYEADPVSIFGGIVVTNTEVDEPTAKKMAEIFLEIIVAPSYTEEALAVLKKKKNLRVLQLASIGERQPEGYDMKKVSGGLLVQERDRVLLNEDDLKVVTKTQPTEKQMADMLFAMKIVKHTKSNGIAIAKDGQSLGIGPGQVNRIWATESAIERSGERVVGAALASDAFFPFDDCAKAAAKAGITCIIQPGGSIRDQDSIDACDEAGIAMVFTGMRHFKH
ncbi:bifunctional phosphoribosylaminoimidazolecarboxamide formyltransferase/IMP cyclohydrolase [Gehongia tenuis]|uniref:Bifunctional purine biosynthesis protein PurH n=1 Tax=Gehongia tenuis TaxID=2763655 RepID=A0A926D5G5_9FIRM|nr:bifunctional phosphoribosylaminoimidazolecarboxamide formyltransferase/IMP cyclohydrolase [Gehongia tenuis]MBC8531976.1 bifunctional phosphoribosylaminoimidazolecarboxamide formyltransferase/IMP cyclohydrolase [Gehongia tenuis]